MITESLGTPALVMSARALVEGSAGLPVSDTRRANVEQRAAERQCPVQFQHLLAPGKRVQRPVQQPARDTGNARDGVAAPHCLTCAYGQLRREHPMKEVARRLGPESRRFGDMGQAAPGIPLDVLV